MKKLHSLLLAMLCLVALAGCQSKTVESAAPEVLKTVPTLTVTCGENSVEALQGPQEWWYDNGDGTYKQNGWFWLDGDQNGIAECYCFDEFGWMYAGCTTPDGYTVDENGAWTEHGSVQMKEV